MDEVDQCLDRLRNQRDRDDVYGAIIALAGMGQPVVARLIQVLLDSCERPDVRSNVGSALHAIGDPAAFEPLMSLLCDPDPEIRASAAYNLGGLRDPRAIPTLERMAASDKGEVVAGNFRYRVADTALHAIQEIRKQPGVPMWV